MPALSTAFTVVSIAASLILLMGGKKKAKKAKNKPVGKRIWSDHLLACAYYSPRTVCLYFNVILVTGDRFLFTDPMPMAEFWGHEYDIGHAIYDTSTNAYTNVGIADCFTIEYPGSSMPDNFFDTLDELKRANRIPKFSRGDGANPQYKTHSLGVATFAVNQGFMGVNNGAIPGYQAILTIIPGTVYLLMKYGEPLGLGDSSYWVRFRKSNYCGDVVDLNPIAIVTDILLDLYRVEDIDWTSAASIGGRLITTFPYMWFSLAYKNNRYSDVLETMSKIARIAVNLSSDGKIRFKLLYDPYEDVSSLPVVRLERMTDVTIEKPSTDSSDVINEFKARYLACRIDEVYDGTGDDAYEYLYNSAAAPPVANMAHAMLIGARKRQSLNLDYLHWIDDVKAYLEDMLDIFSKPTISGSIKTSFAYNYLNVGDGFTIEVPLE